jgi:uncharacterized membrane protein (UPF0127 family)
MKSLEICYSENQTAVIHQTTTMLERMRGLYGKTLDEFVGLWIIPCNSVHTIAMKYPLDLVYLDKQLKIVKLVECLGSWKFSGTFSAHSVIELRAGLINEYGFQKGDIVKFENMKKNNEI